MNTLARMLELSLASNVEVFGQKEIRRQKIQAIPNPLRRYGALAIDKLAGSQPKLAANSLNLLARGLAGLSFVGHGAEYSVYSDGENVIKVHRSSAEWTEARREAFAAYEQTVTGLLCTIMGNMAVTQTYEVGEHPLGKYRAVIARQPYMAGPALQIFNTNQVAVNRPVVAAYCEQVSSGHAALLSLIDSTHNLYDQARLVPDTNGPGNFIVTGPKRALTIIDPQPVSDVGTADLIRHQVDDLAACLSAA